MILIWGLIQPGAALIGKGTGSITRGYILGLTELGISKPNIELPNRGISPSDEGKALIEQALKSGNEKEFIETVDKVCTDEGLDCVGKVNALYICLQALGKKSSPIIRDACMNLVGISFFYK